MGCVATLLHLSSDVLTDYRWATRQEAREEYQRFITSLELSKSLKLVQPGQFAVGHLGCSPQSRALLSDFKTFLEDIVAADANWRHNDPQHSDCDRQNADAHLRAMLLGHSLTLQTSGGEVVLGQWQRILLAELDGPRARTVRIQVMGVA